MPRYIRRNVYKLSGTAWDDYAAKLNDLKTAGDYDDIVELHQHAMNEKTDNPADPNDPSAALTGTNVRFKRNAAHRGPAFLPWHRRYLRHLESQLTAGMTIPYWPWEQDEALADWTSTVLWSSTHLGTLDAAGQVQDGKFATWNPRVFNSNSGTFSTAARPLEREFNFPLGYLPSSAQVNLALTRTDYDSYPWWTNSASAGFRNRLEGFLSLTTDPPSALSHMHNAVHIWIGGDMGPGTSPNDPVFFMHHCNVDRIWAKWQEARRHATGLAYTSHYRPASGGPPGHNLPDALFPWSGVGSRVEDMLDLSAQAFVYDDVPLVTLTSATIEFGPVIAGETSHAAAVFDVIAAFPVEFELLSVSGPEAGFFVDPFASSALRSLAVPDPVELEALGYGWIAYTGEASPASRSADAVIRATLRDPLDDELLWQRDFDVTVTASSIARPSTAVSLVLDQSGSMGWASGFPSKTRLDVLQFSAPPLLELLEVENGIGIVAFDDDAYERMPVTALPGAGATALGHLNAHQDNPLGGTSIADGITRARTQLGTTFVTNEYDDTAVVVLTDGHQTSPGWLEDLPSSAINERIYAIGLGNEGAVDSDKLQLIVNGAQDGFLLLTGDLDAGTDTFLLSKYFLKILAGVTNATIGRDPAGSVTVGNVVRVPFLLSEADFAAEAILLTEHPVIDMALETPAGEIIDLAAAVALAGVQHIEGQTTQAYRVSLPVPGAGGPAHSGTWHALLRLDPARLQAWVRDRYRDLARHTDDASHSKLESAHAAKLALEQELEQIAKLGAKFSFNLILRSNLKMSSRVHQNGYGPGAEMLLRVVLSEYRQPATGRARVRARVRRPDRTETTLQLAEVEPGVHEASVSATLPGVWRFQILAEGETLHGRKFEREDLLSGSVQDPARKRDDPRSGATREPGHRDLCSLARCLLADAGIVRWLEEHGVDVAALRKCVLHGCGGEEARDVKLEQFRAVLVEAFKKFPLDR